MSFNVLSSINLIIPASENETRDEIERKKKMQNIATTGCPLSFLKHQSTNVGRRMSFHVCVFLWQEKQKKLWHAPYYDSEMKLKQQYIKICKNLPAFGCKLYQVKELLRGNAQKKVRLSENVLDEVKNVPKLRQV